MEELEDSIEEEEELDKDEAVEELKQLKGIGSRFSNIILDTLEELRKKDEE